MYLFCHVSYTASSAFLLIIQPMAKGGGVEGTGAVRDSSSIGDQAR